MWTKARGVLLALSLSLNLGVVGVWMGRAWPAFATRTETQGRSASAGCRMCPLHQKLGVSGEQWSQIEPRLAEFQTKAEAQRQKLGDLRMQLVDLLAASPVDRQVIQAKRDEILAAQREMQSLVIDNLLAEKDSLTSEQREGFFQMMRAECARGGLGAAMGACPGANGTK